MALHLLLFTSDGQIALILGKLMSEFDLEVESCSDALASVEKVTRDNFDAIIVDWDDGPEATFLLKTARELKSTRECVALALVSDAAAGACAVQIGAHGILNKPIVPEQIRESIGTIRDMILSRQGSSAAPQTVPEKFPSGSRIQPVRQDQEAEAVVTDSSPGSKDEPKYADDPKLRFLAREPRELPPLPPMPKNLEPPKREASVGTIFTATPYVSEPREVKAPAKRKKKKKKSATWAVLMAGLLMAAAFFYVWAPGSSYFDRVTMLAKSVFTKKEPEKVVLEAKPSPSTAKSTSIEAMREPMEQEQPGPTTDAGTGDESAGNIQVTPVTEPSDINTGAPRPYQAPTPVGASKAEETPAPVAVSNPEPSTQPTPATPVPAATPKMVARAEYPRDEVPQSLKLSNPINPIASGVSPAPPVAAGSSLTAIVIPEETARELLVKKVPPVYPDQALRSGVQGVVVLQAWLGKDGSVRDVKLLRGPFSLARAAVEAVRQWQYKPYILNGQAVEAQTLITVSFKLPTAGSTGSAPPAQPLSSATSDSPKP